MTAGELAHNEMVKEAREKLRKLTSKVALDLYEMSHALDDTRYWYNSMPYNRVALPRKVVKLREAVTWLREVNDKYWAHRTDLEGYWRYCCDAGIAKDLEELKPNYEEIGEVHEFKDRAYWKTEG